MAWAPQADGLPGDDPGLNSALLLSARVSRAQTAQGGVMRGLVMRGLSGRTYIVTGAASGIGRATAARLAEEGATVMGADLAEPWGDDGWSFTRTDVTDEDAVARLVQAAVGLG